MDPTEAREGRPGHEEAPVVGPGPRSLAGWSYGVTFSTITSPLADEDVRVGADLDMAEEHAAGGRCGVGGDRARAPSSGDRLAGARWRR